MSDTYDAGLLASGGGGNIEWWHDYIRMLLRQSHEFYTRQIENIENELKGYERIRGIENAF